MRHPPEQKLLLQPAPCRSARRLLTVAIITSTLLVLATAGDWALRRSRQNDAAKSWMNALTLSAPALYPAGNPVRHPETVHPAVDLRFSPGLGTPP